jgi:hypothetical protein
MHRTALEVPGKARKQSMNLISNSRQTTASGISTGSISTEEIKSRIAAMFGDAPAATQDK